MKFIKQLFSITLLLLAFFSWRAQGQDSLLIRPLFVLGKPGADAGQFNAPQAVSVDPNGHIYVADTGNNRIQKLDANGKVLAMTGGFGWGQDQFQRPVDVCAENGLDVFVADYQNRRIVRLDKDLHWIDAYQFRSEGEEKLTLGFPQSLAISIHGDLYIADAENYRVLKLNTRRVPELQFGDFDWGEGNLLDPQKILITTNDRIYISDRQRAAVLLYDYFGNYLYEIGDITLKMPTGLAVDALGRLYAGDEALQTISVFDNQGRPVARFGSPGDKLGAFAGISDVALHRDLLYICEADNHRIQVLQLLWGGKP